MYFFFLASKILFSSSFPASQLFYQKKKYFYQKQARLCRFKTVKTRRLLFYLSSTGRLCTCCSRIYRCQSTISPPDFTTKSLLLEKHPLYRYLCTFMAFSCLKEPSDMKSNSFYQSGSHTAAKLP